MPPRLPGLVLLLAPLLPAQTPCPSTPSHIVMNSGSFSSQPGVTFTLRHFNASLVPLAKTAPACFQKMTVVSRAEIFVSNETLTHVFAEKLNGTQNKIRNFKVENGIGKVTLSGNITKLIPIAFTIEGPVTTDGTFLLVDASKIKADGIPIKALLAMVGEHLSNILGMKGVNGVTVQGNSLIFSPEAVAHLKGHIQSVETSATGLILRYGKASPTPK